MDLNLEFKSVLNVNMDNIFEDLDMLKRSESPMFDIEFLAKVHSLKHQLLFLKLDILANYAFELEKYISRIMKNNLVISMKQIDLITVVLGYIYYIINDNEDKKEYISNFEDRINKLVELNRNNEEIQNEERLPFIFSNKQLLKRDTKINIMISLESANKVMLSLYDLQKYISTCKEIDIKKLKNKVDTITTGIEEFRRISINDFTTKIKTMVNTIASDCGKPVRCYVKTDDSEIDQIVIDLLIDPIFQIIKNNIIHGIETVEERKSKNKTAYGNIYVNIYNHNDMFNIEIINDGKPIDTNMLRKRFNIKNCNDSEICNLIFMPFVSLREDGDINAGSGIGLAGVRHRIEHLGGKITVVSDEITMFKISVPGYLYYENYCVFSFYNFYFAISSRYIDEHFNHDDLFDLTIIDLRNKKEESFIFHEQCFTINYNHQGFLFISDQLYRNYLLHNSKVKMDSQFFVGYSFMNDKVVFLLSDDSISIYGYEILSDLLKYKFRFKKKDGEVISLNIDKIVSITVVSNDNDITSITRHKQNYLAVTYIEDGKNFTFTAVQILDIEL
jgi:signal transduction histidine kinase